MDGLKFFSHTFKVCIVPALILIIWEVMSLTLRGSTIFVSPYEGLRYFFAQFSDDAFYGYFVHTMVSLAIGFGLSASGGFILGFLLGLDRGVERIASSLIHGLYTIPKVTLYPMLLLFFGIGLMSQIVFVFIHGIFPMMVITMAAVGFVGKDYAKLAAANCLTNWQYLFKVLFPAVLPSLVSGLRICFSACFLSLILAELLGSGEGLGGQIRKAITLTDMRSIVAIVIDVALIAIVISQILQQLERVFLNRWGRDGDSQRRVEKVSP